MKIGLAMTPVRTTAATAEHVPILSFLTFQTPAYHNHDLRRSLFDRPQNHGAPQPGASAIRVYIGQNRRTAPAVTVSTSTDTDCLILPLKNRIYLDSHRNVNETVFKSSLPLLQQHHMD